MLPDLGSIFVCLIRYTAMTADSAINYNSRLIESIAPFSMRLTCACEIPISSATSVWVLPLK